MPNTFLMQEIMSDYDCYVDDLEKGKSPAHPVVFRIPKGTEDSLQRVKI